MTATQLKPARLPKSIKTKKATTARRVQELLLEIAYAMHATKVVRTAPLNHQRAKTDRAQSGCSAATLCRRGTSRPALNTTGVGAADTRR
jgi:hypothetical protein